MVLTSDTKTVRSLLQHLQFAKADAFRTWQYSNTLRVPGFEDSLSDEAHGLCCQPLVGQPITVGNGASRMAIAPDGDYAYVPNGTDNTVSVINIQPQ